jgi:hypothetical protein
MAALSAQAAIAIAIQQVSDTVPLLVERSNQLDQLIQDNGRAEQVSNISFRIPFESALPGSYGMVNLDSSTVGLPAGGSSEFVQGTITPIAGCVPIEWTKLAELVDKPPTAVKSAVTGQMGRAMDRMKVARDINLCTGDGTGKLATITAVNGTTLTLDSTSYGTRTLVKNQYVQIFNGTVLRPSGNAYGNSVQVTKLYKQLGQANTVTLDTLPAGTAVGDFIMVDGVANGGPVFVHGIESYMSNSQTGLTLNTDRSVNNWLQANGYDATGGQVTLPLLRLMLDQIKNALGENAVTAGGLVIHTSQGQVAQYEQLGEQFGMIPFEDGKANNLDPMFKGKKSVDGHPVIANIHANNSRWDALSIKNWGKVKWGQGTFWFNQDGQTVFPVIASNGSPTTSARSFLIDTGDYYVDNFQAQSSLYNTAPAQGYAN